ncbi:radical SAM family heme chaperone HemW [soil metagenome]
MAAGIYIHIPFCRSRCSYCDFATDVWRSGDAVQRYVDALCTEIDSSKGAPLGPAKGNLAFADTIYFGGGTPSLLDPAQVEDILAAVNSRFDVADNTEITMEMNPGTVTPDSLADYRSLGVNRASFGLQTFNNRDLMLLARGHNAKDARDTFRMLRDAGFTNVSFDLIAGLPGQTMDDWQRNLNEAAAMEPEHLSLYLLEIHEGTPLAAQVQSGRRPQPDDDVAAEMYEMMIDRLCEAGYVQYEISNFAKPGFESRHNTKYWRLEPVYGFGVSAHAFDGRERYSNERDTAKYISMITSGGSAEVSREAVDPASESAFLGLRLNEGIDVVEYDRRHSTDLSSKMGRLEENGLVEVAGGRLRLTRKGMLFSNEVFAEFV